MKSQRIIWMVLVIAAMSACTKLNETNYSSYLASDYYMNNNEVVSAVLRPYTHTSAWITSSGQVGY